MNDLALNVTLDIISGIVLLIIIISQWMNANWHSKADRYFFTVLCLMLATLTLDAISWLVDGKPGGFYFVLAYTVNSLSYVIGMLVNYFFILYISESIPLVGWVKKIINYATKVTVIAFIILMIVDLFNGMIFYIDENNVFHWGLMYWLPYLVTSIPVILIVWAVFLNRKKLGGYATLSYASYAIIPLLASCINLYFFETVIVYAAMAIALLIVFVNIQMQRERKMREQELILQNQELALKISQIHPHFVFNTLTAIKSLYRTNPEKAEMTLDNFSSHLRTMIESPERPNMIRFHDELHNVYTYLSIEKQRFGDKFEVEYDIGERFFFIPLLTLQPIVENAVLHGLTIGKGGTKLTIKTMDTPTDYIITVEDDGNGFDLAVPPKEGKIYVGINNVRSRLKTLCNGQLKIESKPGEGTKATIIIPKERQAE